jgi:hypothetical protein
VYGLNVRCSLNVHSNFVSLRIIYPQEKSGRRFFAKALTMRARTSSTTS